MARRIPLFLVLVTLGVSGALASARLAPSSQAPPTEPTATVNVTLGQSAVPLYGPWQFTVGDSPIDPATNQPLWSEPGFDDSRWEPANLTPQPGAFDPTNGWAGYVPGWTVRGHPGHWGYAWYRIRVQAPPEVQHQRLALALWDVDDAYQFFVNGRIVGSFGEFSSPESRPVDYWSEPRKFILPTPPPGAGKNSGEAIYTLVFRVWAEPNTLNQNPDAGGFHVAPVIGPDAAVIADYQTAWLALIRTYGSSAAEAALYLMLAIAACSLILFDPSDPVYLWLAGVFLLTALNAANTCLIAWTQAENELVLYLVGDGLLTPAILGGWVMVWWVWFRLRHPSWVPWTIAGLTAFYALSNALGEDLFFTFMQHSLSAAFHVVSVVIRLLFLVLLLFIVTRGVRQQGREGWLALPGVVLVGIAQFQVELLMLRVPTMWFPLGMGLYLDDIANAVLSAVMFVLLMRRLVLSLRHQRQMALDVKQAQEVQQVILPEARLTLPGLTIESEYRPAREVGGDFFQIIPDKSDGSLLIVAGDVAGKGLQAGMLVALLVGAIRTAAQYNPDPLEVLKTLNQRLLGRGEAQATCLALRIANDGAARLANAGHIAPCLNGEVLPMEGALPLGLIEGVEPSLMHFKLAVGDKLLLMSDGIAEATDADGQLFGFERAHELLRTSTTAAAIAAAAQRFGQEDDISVISVTRTAMLQPA